MVGVGGENRRQIHGLGAEVLQVVEVIDHAAQVAAKEVAAADGLLVPTSVPRIAVALVSWLSQLAVDVERFPDRKALGKDLIDHGEDLASGFVAWSSTARICFRSVGSAASTPWRSQVLVNTRKPLAGSTAVIAPPREGMTAPALPTLSPP